MKIEATKCHQAEDIVYRYKSKCIDFCKYIDMKGKKNEISGR